MKVRQQRQKRPAKKKCDRASRNTFEPQDESKHWKFGGPPCLGPASQPASPVGGRVAEIVPRFACTGDRGADVGLCEKAEGVRYEASLEGPVPATTTMDGIFRQVTWGDGGGLHASADMEWDADANV